MTSIRWLVLAVALVTPGIAPAQVIERAFEEIMPGVRVRGGSAVVMDVGPKGCDPPCSGDLSCRYDCRETPCEPSAGPLAKCNRCDWRCIE